MVEAIMRECPYCGAQVAVQALGCAVCGNAIADAESLHTTTPFPRALDHGGRPAEDFHDTIRALPAVDMEILDEDADEEAARETLIDAPPLGDELDEGGGRSCRSRSHLARRAGRHPGRGAARPAASRAHHLPGFRQSAAARAGHHRRPAARLPAVLEGDGGGAQHRRGPA